MTNGGPAALHLGPGARSRSHSNETDRSQRAPWSATPRRRGLAGRRPAAASSGESPAVKRSRGSPCISNRPFLSVPASPDHGKWKPTACRYEKGNAAQLSAMAPPTSAMGNADEHQCRLSRDRGPVASYSQASESAGNTMGTTSISPPVLERCRFSNWPPQVMYTAC